MIISFCPFQCRGSVALGVAVRWYIHQNYNHRELPTRTKRQKVYMQFHALQVNLLSLVAIYCPNGPTRRRLEALKLLGRLEWRNPFHVVWNTNLQSAANLTSAKVVIMYCEWHGTIGNKWRPHPYSIYDQRMVPASCCWCRFLLACFPLLDVLSGQ